MANPTEKDTYCEACLYAVSIWGIRDMGAMEYWPQDYKCKKGFQFVTGRMTCDFKEVAM